MHEPPTGTAWYRGAVDLDPERGTLDASWTVTLLDARDPEVHFLVDADLTVDSVGGPAVRGWSSEPSSASGQLARVTVTLSEEARDPSVDIAFAFHGAPFPDPRPGDINRIAPEWIELGIDAFWFPALEGFPWDIGGEATLGVPAGWTVVSASGTQVSEGRVTVRFPGPTPDLAFTAAPAFEASASDGFTVFELTGTDAATAELLRSGTACAGWLEARFGDAGPLPHTRVVVTPRRDSGYARKGYVVLSSIEGKSGTELAEFVCHEMAHAWNVGSAGTRDRWLSEGIAQYLALMFLRAHRGQASYDDMLARSRERSEGLPPVWTEDARGVPEHAVMYHKAPVILGELESLIGTDALEAWFLALFREGAETTGEALRLLDGVAGEHAADALSAALAAGG